MSTAIESLTGTLKSDLTSEKGQAQVKEEFIDLCISGDVNQVAEYLEKMPELANTYSIEDGIELEPVLVIAIAHKHDEVLKTLLRYKPNVDAPCQAGPLNGMSAAFYAAKLGRWDLVECLVEAGADPNHCPVEGSCEGETLLSLAYWQNKWDYIKRLRELGAKDLEPVPPAPALLLSSPVSTPPLLQKPQKEREEPAVNSSLLGKR